jgi:hypothetical protein
VELLGQSCSEIRKVEMIISREGEQARGARHVVATPVRAWSRATQKSVRPERPACLLSYQLMPHLRRSIGLDWFSIHDLTVVAST